MSAAPPAATSTRRRDLAYAPYAGMRLRGAGVHRRRRRRARAGAHPRGRGEHRSCCDAGSPPCPTGRCWCRSPAGRARAKASPSPRRSAATCWCGCASSAAAIARCHVRDAVLVPVAAAGGRDRGQHRRRLPAVQQIVQLLLFGARSLTCARCCSNRCSRRPVTIGARRRAADAALAEVGRALEARARRLFGRSIDHPRGRRRLVQRLRAGDPRAQQRGLRRRALRPPFRRLAAPRRRAAGDRPGDAQHEGGAGAHLCGDARSEMGGGGRRLRLPAAACSRAATPWSARSSKVIPVDLVIRGCPPRPIDLLRGLIALIDKATEKRGKKA